MSASPILAIHICSGVVGLLSGAVAVSLRKGSRRHRVAGIVFAVSMLSLAACGVYLAFMKHKMGDVLGGTLTLYLVVTAWTTARRRDGKPGIVDWGALLVALGLVSVTATWALQAANSQTGMKN